jgi:hypothetical protein
LEQITSTRPLRRMILHFSHIGLTEGRTFTLALSARGSYLKQFPQPGSGGRRGRRYPTEAMHAAQSSRCERTDPS